MMYYILALQVSNSAQIEPTIVEIESLIREHSDDAEYVKSLDYQYIIRGTPRTRSLLYKKLVQYYDAHKGEFRFTLTPLIGSGRVVGAVPSDRWPKIRQITIPDEEADV